MEAFLSKIEISPSMLLVSAGLIVIALGLRNTPFIPCWIILWITIFLGVICNLFISGFSFESGIEGIISAGIAITFHQTLTQTKDGLVKNKNKT